MPRITKQDSLHFQLRLAMSNKLKRAWVAYQKYKLITRIIAAFAGAIAGISGCVAYVKVYQNYNAATWAAISAVFAILFLRINFSVRRDHERLITRETFTLYMCAGIFTLVAGLAATITYIELGVKHNEKEITADGYLVVCIWTIKSLGWGFFIFMSARKFKKEYLESSPCLVQSTNQV